MKAISATSGGGLSRCLASVRESQRAAMSSSSLGASSMAIDTSNRPPTGVN